LRMREFEREYGVHIIPYGFDLRGFWKPEFTYCYVSWRFGFFFFVYPIYSYRHPSLQFYDGGICSAAQPERSVSRAITTRAHIDILFSGIMVSRAFCGVERDDTFQVAQLWCWFMPRTFLWGCLAGAECFGCGTRIVFA
jgi:hypothetical protein